MDKDYPSPPLSEISYHSPAVKLRFHPLAILSISLSSMFFMIIFVCFAANFSWFDLPFWLRLNDMGTSCTASFLTLLSGYVAITAMGAIKERPRKWTGLKLAIAALILSAVQLLMLLLLMGNNLYNASHGL